jgi:surface antigen
MAHHHRFTARVLTQTIMGLSLITLLGLAMPAPAQADQPGWGNSHGNGYGHRVNRRNWRQWKQYRKAQRRHRWSRPSYGGSDSTKSGGNFLKDITGGHLIGGILGAATGTQFGKGRGRVVAVLGGAILGAVLGNEVSKSIKENDRRQAQSTLETVPTGQTIAWRNPDTGARYNITPTETYQKPNGRYCREYTTWVFIDGYEEKATGTACRAPDGAWLPTTH